MNLLSYRCIPPHLQGQVPDVAANEQINLFNVALQKAQRAEGHSFVSRTQRAVSRYGEQPLTLLRAVLLNPSSRKQTYAHCWTIRCALATRLPASCSSNPQPREGTACRMDGLIHLPLSDGQVH